MPVLMPKMKKVTARPPGWVEPIRESRLGVRAARVAGRPYVDVEDLAAFLEASHPEVAAWLLGAVPHIQ